MKRLKRLAQRALPWWLGVVCLCPVPAAENWGVVGLNVKELGRPETGWWPSNLEYHSYSYEKGDVKMSGVVVKPQGKGPFPGVVFNHGGGSTAMAEGIEYGVQFALGGYVSITCDGTQSRLERMGEWRRKGQPDRTGLHPPASIWDNDENRKRALANIEILHNLTFVDPAKIAMAGLSMGGYLTIEMIQMTDRIRVAAVMAAGSRAADRFPGPSGSFENIRAPLLLVAGEVDPVVPLSAILELKRTLDKHGKKSKLLVFPGESHNVIQTRINTVFEHVLEWFDRHFGRPGRPNRSLLPPTVQY
ncbi:MAG: prolyl oligopeptidase family serine peptidase [Acidobacteria bacterium]|nr:prolyl oligopeptidase family serine peptidase [Acidobacteriota bacterium]